MKIKGKKSEPKAGDDFGFGFGMDTARRFIWRVRTGIPLFSTPLKAQIPAAHDFRRLTNKWGQCKVSELSDESRTVMRMGVMHH